MQAFKIKAFAKWASGEGLSDVALASAVAEMEMLHRQERRNAVADNWQIVDVTLNPGSECTTETNGKCEIQGQTGTTFGMATIPTTITWLLPTGH